MATSSYVMTRKINMFFLPFAGGSFYSYRDFRKYLPEHIAVTATDPPGHGRRMREPLLTDIHDMTEDIFRSIKDSLNEPCAIFGHSMGSLLGYLLCKKISDAGKYAPLHLFVSGRYAPSVESREKDLHKLPRNEFIRKIKTYGGLPKEVAESEELMDLFVPIIKADFQAVSEYRYEPSEPLDIPLTVMIGEEEDTSYEEALRWQEMTARKISVRQFSGGHFFIFDHLPEIGKLIAEHLEKT